MAWGWFWRWARPEMAHQAFCRYCDHRIEVVGGHYPPVCPNTRCGRDARWTTEPPRQRLVLDDEEPPAKDPQRPYVVTWFDERFLRNLKINPEVDD